MDDEVDNVTAGMQTNHMRTAAPRIIPMVLSICPGVFINLAN